MGGLLVRHLCAVGVTAVNRDKVLFVFQFLAFIFEFVGFIYLHYLSLTWIMGIVYNELWKDEIYLKSIC